MKEPPASEPLFVGQSILVYDQYRGGYSEASISYIRSQVQLSSSSVMLDLACGTGLVLREFVSDVYYLYGLDRSFDMLLKAREMYPHRARLVQGRGEALPFPAALFDLVTIGQAIHWFDLSRLVPELARVMKPGCWLAIISKYPSPHEPYRSLYESLLERRAPTGAGQLTAAQAVGNVLGLERYGFEDYRRKVFPWEMTRPVESYLNGVAAGAEVQTLSDADRAAFLQEFERAVQQYAPDGVVRELYFDYVIMVRRTA